MRIARIVIMSARIQKTRPFGFVALDGEKAGAIGLKWKTFHYTSLNSVANPWKGSKGSGVGYFLGIILFGLVQFQANAGDRKCIDLAIFPPKSAPVFRLHYELFPRVGLPWSSHEKTVIFVQGGPGIEGLGQGRPPFIPEEFQVVVLDPRGVGQSVLPESLSAVPETSSSELLAGDLMKLVHQEQLTNFIFWAHSFGTVVATIAASKMTLKPKALILEGTIGRAFKKTANGEHEINVGYRDAFQEAYSHVTAFDKMGVVATT